MTPQDDYQTFNNKLFSLQQEIAAVKKSSTNPHFKSQYADLNEVLDVCKAALHAKGLYVIQPVGKDAHGHYVKTLIRDVDSMQAAESTVYLSGNEENMQKIGAAITYARRYGLISLLAMESEDDDGETAVGRGAAQKAREGAAASRGKEAKAQPPLANQAQAETRPKINKLISQTCKVAMDMKKLTFDQAAEMVSAYGVKTKEELTDTQALELLNALRGIINE